MSLLIGYDVGSSSVKACLFDSQTGKTLAVAASPDKELAIIAKKPGWAEQNPSVWWEHLKNANAKLKAIHDFDPADVKAIGISYQMHGLVAVDKACEVLRPAIIWCDSRAVEIGKKAAQEIGDEKCLKNLLNLPGNFTASKLKWVKDNEPDIYSRIDKIMMPGDWIAMKMTGVTRTTYSGLSEAILWDYHAHGVADFLLDYYGIDPNLIPEACQSFAEHGALTVSAAAELGLAAGTPVTYKGGDQPNNALSLGVLEPGQAAVTAGTSGVVCGITDKNTYDTKSRVNSFVHVNYTKQNPRHAVLLCVNGTGILNSWLKHNFLADGTDYDQMNALAATVPVGSEGLSIMPYGNGAERVLENQNIGAMVKGWNFNIHKRAHFLRAAQEGIVFALNLGLDVMRQMDMKFQTVKAGKANMFLSPVFAQTFATLTGAKVELYQTDGSAGAARGAGFGAGIYKSLDESISGLKPIKTIEPETKLAEQYSQAFERWKKYLEKDLRE